MMNIREYKADKDFSIIQDWITDAFQYSTYSMGLEKSSKALRV